MAIVSNTLSVMTAWVAHVLTWAAGAWLAFGPIYHGVEYRGVTGRSGPSSSTLNPEEWTPFTESLIEANGLGAVWIVMVPILVTGIVGWTVYRADIRRVWRKVMIWVLAIALFGFCVMNLLTIGIFYLPAALALLIAAVANSVARIPHDDVKRHEPHNRGQVIT